MKARVFTAGTVLLLLAAVAARPAVAAMKLNSLICDNMVLQRGMETPVWGTAEPGAQVVVTLSDQEATTTADEEGKWTVKFRPFRAGGPLEMTVLSAEEITITNIMVGDVWICSGQSNMALTVSSTINAAQDIAAANYPSLRLFTVDRKFTAEPREDVAGAWVECSPETVPSFSATAYYFGRKMHEALGVPIGLINTSWGGTPAEAWTSRSKLGSRPILQAILDRWEVYSTEQYPKLVEQYPAKVEAWEKKAEAAKAEGEKPPRKPRPPTPPVSQRAPGCLYNGMIAPLIPYAIKGAIWYQGEANAGRAWEYRTLFAAMIRDWRQAWGQGNFPFLWVQLPNFRAIHEEPGDSTWAELREAQARTLRLTNTGMGCIIEHGEADDIHPKNKRPAGERMALWALARFHAQHIPYAGPTYRSAEIEGDRVRIHFDHVGSRLARRVTDNAPYPTALTGFEIAGKNRKFVWAHAKFDGDTVVVWSEAVKRPVAVRYAWSDNPVCNLFNADSLPAPPFRTDQWPGITWPKRR